MKTIITCLFAIGTYSASAAIVSISDDFGTDTSASYTAATGFTTSYTASDTTDFGDGTDGQLRIAVAGSSTTGTLVSASLGTIALSDVGKELTLTMRVDGQGGNFHRSTLGFLVDGAAVGSTILTRDDFLEYDSGGEAGLVPTDGTTTLEDWRNKNGVGTVSYTITGADVGGTLSWGMKAVSTSGGGYAFGIDNWELIAVPEPSSAALLGLGGLALMLRRKK